VGSEVFSVIAATFHGNRGAQAMLETVIGRLRRERPSLRFHVFSYYPHQDRRLVDADHVVVHSATPLALVAWLLPWSLLFGLLLRLFGRGVLPVAPAAIRALAQSRALVDLAGVSFIDGRGKFLPFNALTLLPAWLLGTPIVKMPQAMGPFERPVNRMLAGLLLPRCDMVWARGAGTYDHLQASRLRGLRFAQADDIAFNHHDDYDLTRENADVVDALLRELRTQRARAPADVVVGICPSSVVAARTGGRRYEAMLATLVQDLSRRGCQVVLFPNATREHGEGERNNDLPLLRRIRYASGEDAAPLLFDRDVSASGIKRIIAATDLVLTSRFHAMVGALALQVPVVVLGWSHKYAEVMARFGLDDYVLNESVLDEGKLDESRPSTFVLAAISERERIRRLIVEHLPEVSASAERPVLSLLSDAFGADLA